MSVEIPLSTVSFFLLKRVDDRVCTRLNLYMVFIIYLSLSLNSLTKDTIDTIIAHGTSPKDEPFYKNNLSSCSLQLFFITEH